MFLRSVYVRTHAAFQTFTSSSLQLRASLRARLRATAGYYLYVNAVYLLLKTIAEECKRIQI
jgi:hypothetical protein